ncbi:MAG TPA: FkbM family methyltransferase [Microbacteriaceae bacterium]
MKITRYWGFLRSLIIYYRPTQRALWLRFYKHLLPKNAIVFDIGAHVGSRARTMRKAGAKVIALEPQQPFANFLRKTLPSDVVFIEAAAGEEESQIEMWVSTKHPTVSSLKKDFVSSAPSAPGFKHVRWDKKQLVSVVTIDSLIKSHGTPDYIKIDVEGFELEVLKGLSKPIGLISCEMLPGFPELSIEVLYRISELGNYEFNLVVGETAKFLWPDWGNQKAVRDWIENQSPKTKPADLFARLVSN